MFFFFFLPCVWLPPPLVRHIAILATSLRCADFFCFCFYRNLFCSPAINQISLSQSKDWFPFILLCRREKYRWTGPLGLCINYTNRISELYLHMYLLKINLNVINCLSLVHTYRRKIIFHWRLKTGLKDGFIMYYSLWGPSFVKIVNCAINLSQYLLLTHTDYYALRKNNHYHSVSIFQCSCPEW